MHEDFSAAGALADAYRAVDWSATALGPPASWGAELRAALDLALHTRFPVTLFWGPEHVMFYNEAYVELIGDKHPFALGVPAQQVFPEVWEVVGPMLDGVFAGADATWTQDLRLPLHRRGFLEECFFTFSYSALRSEHGDIQGIIDIATETTPEMLGRRRLELLTRLGSALAPVEDISQLQHVVRTLLDGATPDLPSVALRLLDGADSSRPDPLVSPPTSPRPDSMVVEDDSRLRTAVLRLHGAVGEPSVEVHARLSDQLPADEAYLQFLGLVAESLTQAWDRLRARATQRGLSEALQRNLLSAPIATDRLQVAVRYQPASQALQVGGDWYDSFLAPDGALTLVVGDVSGHDQQSAVAMAQVRNLLRGIAFASADQPAAALAGLDRAMQGLQVTGFATAVFARVLQRDGAVEAGPCTFAWSSAGHLPPAVLQPDGVVRLLETPADLLLGLSPDTERVDHETVLEHGAKVVLYTDGLIERRSASLHDGLTALAAVLQDRQDLSADELCDHLLEHFGSAAEDDIVVLVLGVGA